MRHAGGMLSRRVAVLVPAVAASLVLAACSSDSEPKAEPEASQGAGAKLVQVSPVTGEALPDGPPDNPVFVVKIENTANGAPQVALDKADLVVEELVEGGLTRLAALYYSELPDQVGHVRSMRATDIGIAAPVAGQIVASGGASGTIRKVKKAGITVFSEDEGAAGFSSDPAKVRPYNRLIDLQRLDKAAKVAPIPGPYLSWTPGYTDPAGNPVPETKMKGSGRAVLLTADGALETTWTKTSNDSTITFEAKDGTPVRVTPGKTWIELVPEGDGALDVG